LASVFVSYAQVDNQAFSGEEKGWITHFVNNLRKEVNRRLGRAEDYQLWMDFRLKGNDELTPAIEKQVKQADTLVLFLSTGWLASTWCQQELRWFVDDPAKQHAGRIFVVELESFDPQTKPEAFRDCLNYPFWQKTDQDKVRQLGYPLLRKENSDFQLYFDRLLDLCRDLATKLSQHRNKPEPPEIEIKATVYVAPVGDALYENRASLITELRQFGIDSIPRNNALDLDSFKQAMERDLAQCSHFVQLLDTDWNLGIPAKQLRIAETSGKPILQWRSRDLDYTKAREEQKKLLEGKHVIACTQSEFTQHVRKAVLPEPEPEPKPEEEPEVAKPPITQKMVFVHTGQQDLQLARKIAGDLLSKGYGYALPRYTGDAASIRKSIERGLTSCDVLLMLQRETPAEALDDFLSEAHLSNLDQGKHLAMLMCRTQEAEALTFFPPGLRVLQCNCLDFTDYCLEQFLQAVAP
jgi:hypothetical protein